MKSSRLFWRRILSRLIDLGVPTIWVIPSYWILLTSDELLLPINEIISLFMLIWIIYCLFIIVSVIYSRGRTLGDIIMKIDFVDQKSNQRALGRILIKELTILLFLWGTIYDNNFTALAMIIIFGMPIGRSEINNNLISGIDSVLKLSIIRAYKKDGRKKLAAGVE